MINRTIILLIASFALIACSNSFNMKSQKTGGGKDKFTIVNKWKSQKKLVAITPSNRELEQDKSIKYQKADATPEINEWDYVTSINSDDLQLIVNQECDEVIKRNGEIVSAKVTEIGLKTIKYKLCSNLNGPIHVVLKSDVFMIRYANGDTQLFEEEEEEVIEQEEVKTDAEIERELDDFMYRKTGVDPMEERNKYYWNGSPKPDGFAITAFVFSLIALGVNFFWYSILGISIMLFAFIFSLISLGRIKRSENVLRGKGLAVTALIISLLLFAGLGVMLLFFT